MHSESVHQQIEQDIQLLESGKKEIMPFQVCNRLADYTTQLIIQEEVGELKNCLRRLAGLYKNTKNNMMRVAIENGFIYSLGTKIMLCSKRRKMLNQFPQIFRNMITGQAIAASI
jgi:hypothetical protein